MSQTTKTPFAIGATVRVIGASAPATHQGQVGTVETFDESSGLYQLRDRSFLIGGFHENELALDEGPVTAEDVWAVATGILRDLQDKHGFSAGMSHDVWAAQVRERLIHRLPTASALGFTRHALNCMSQTRTPGSLQAPASQQGDFYEDERWGSCVRRVAMPD